MILKPENFGEKPDVQAPMDIAKSGLTENSIWSIELLGFSIMGIGRIVRWITLTEIEAITEL